MNIYDFIMFYPNIIWIIVFIFFHRSRKLPLFCWSPKCFTCHSYWTRRLDNFPHNVRDRPCNRSESAILAASEICYKLPPKVFVISSSYKLFKNAERVNIACLIGFSNNTVYKVCWNIQSKDGKARDKITKITCKKERLHFWCDC